MQARQALVNQRKGLPSALDVMPTKVLGHSENMANQITQEIDERVDYLEAMKGMKQLQKQDEKRIQGEIRARIAEIPMPAIYENESSNLKISKIVIPFIRQHLKAACRRFMMEYFVRGLSVATVTLPIGLFATVWGVGFTVYLGYQSNYLGIPASSGDIALSILSVLLGVQFSIAAFTEDLAKKSGLVEIVIIAKDN